MKFITKPAIFFYLLSLFLLTVYSFSQVDLNLTLSQNRIYLDFQKIFTALGYFQRPLSTYIYSALVAILFVSFGLILYSIQLFNISIKNVIYVIAASILLVFIAYPAFSHDFFNYMFDARIVSKYNLNPYFYKALDFPQDPWIRFMHWTHRTFPYGPVWLLVTLPFSYLGFGKFLPTMYLFKAMFALFHVGNIYLINKLLDYFQVKNKHFNLLFYALNPLILAESLISPHNEVVLLFFLLLSLYFLLIKRRKIAANIILLLSVGVKFVTVIILPVYLIFGKWLKSNRQAFVNIILFLLLIPLMAEIINREPYPWYFIPLIGISALSRNRKLIIFMTALSLSALLRYIPFLYYGSYDLNTVILTDYLFYLPLVLTALILLFFHLESRLLRNRLKSKS